ncbi:MAG: methyltransferase domain-containing protein, partial [Pedobacter sp.]
MKDKNIINSSIYWDGRFEEDWESREGPRQSRFFSHIAIENLPPWLLKEINRNSYSLVDWGCAQGDGTDVWASYMDSEHISGVDFSAVAIEQAMQRYPAIRFIAQDWVANRSCGEQFDVVFSSNTLEHFHKPYDVLESISTHAKKAVILALPYRESERIDEHFYSFLPENIPSVLTNGFRLTWCRVVDCRSLPNTLWGGDQVILIYGEPKWLDGLGLTLADCLVDVVDTKSEIKQLSLDIDQREAKLSAASQLIEMQTQQIESLGQQAADNAIQLSQIKEKHHVLVNEKEKETVLLKNSVVEKLEENNLLKDLINKKLDEIIVLRNFVHESKEEIEILKSTVNQKDGEIFKLNQAVIDRDRWLEEYNRQMLTLKGSRSWRITSPLRMIGAALKSPSAPSANMQESPPQASAVATQDESSPLWRKRLVYLASRYRNGIQKHGLVRSVPLALRASHRLGSVWLNKQVRRKSYEQKLVQLRKIITGHADFIDIFHVPMGWSTPLFQRFQHMSLQAAQLGGLALYGGHLQVDKDLFVFNRAEGNVIVFDALDDQVVKCVFDALATVKQSKMLRLQSIDLA